MNTFILWLQVVLITGFGEIEHRQTMTHPMEFDSFQECQTVAETRKEFILKDLQAAAGNYMVISDCEPVSAAHPDWMHRQSRML